MGVESIEWSGRFRFREQRSSDISSIANVGCGCPRSVHYLEFGNAIDFLWQGKKGHDGKERGSQLHARPDKQ